MAEAKKQKIELDPNPDSVLGASPEYREAWNAKYGEEHRERVAQQRADADEAARLAREENSPVALAGEDESTKNGEKK